MRWIESDHVILSQERNTAHDQARVALRERFPNSWQWYAGFSKPHTLYAEQMNELMKTGEVPPEVEEWALDQEQLREMVSFLMDNWVHAGEVEHWDYEDWKTCYEALRYAAEEIGYLPKTEAAGKLREHARELSARMIAERRIQTGNINDLDMGDPPFYEHDWIACLHAFQYCMKNMSPDNPEMVEFRKRLEHLTPTLFNRVKHASQAQMRSWGYDDVKIERRLNDILIEPWDPRRGREDVQQRYWKLRELQDDHEQHPGDWLHVLRFVVRAGSTVQIYDKLGNHKGTEVTDESCGIRGWDLSFAFGSDTFTFGKWDQDRMQALTCDVDIYESEVSCMLNQLPDWIDYIYANFKVHKCQLPRP